MTYKLIVVVFFLLGSCVLLYTDYQWHLSYNQQVQETKQKNVQQEEITQEQQELNTCIKRAQSWADLTEAGAGLAYVASDQNQEAVSIQACQTEYPISPH
jgi:hypothetical protein